MTVICRLHDGPFSAYAINSYSQRLNPSYLFFWFVHPLRMKKKKKTSLTKNVNSPLSSCHRPDKQDPTSNFQFTIDILVHDVKGIGINLLKSFRRHARTVNFPRSHPPLQDGKMFLMNLRFPPRRISRRKLETRQLPQPSSEGSPRIFRYPGEVSSLVSRACHMVTLST